MAQLQLFQFVWWWRYIKLIIFNHHSRGLPGFGSGPPKASKTKCTNAYTQQLHHTYQNCVYQSPPALDVISCVQQHMAISSCQGRQRQHTDLSVSPSPDLVSGISYLRLCAYHRHLDSFKASRRQYFFARPTRHDSARSRLLRLLELRLTNFPTYLLTY